MFGCDAQVCLVCNRPLRPLLQKRYESTRMSKIPSLLTCVRLTTSLSSCSSSRNATITALAVSAPGILAFSGSLCSDLLLTSLVFSSQLPCPSHMPLLPLLPQQSLPSQSVPCKFSLSLRVMTCCSLAFFLSAPDHCPPCLPRSLKNFRHPVQSHTRS